MTETADINTDPEITTDGPWRYVEITYMGETYYRVESMEGELVAVAYKPGDADTIIAAPQTLVACEELVSSFAAHSEGDFEAASDLIQSALGWATDAVLLAYGIDEAEVDADVAEELHAEEVEALNAKIVMLEARLEASRSVCVQLNEKLNSVAAAFRLVA